jgi:MarR family transcriptional regulator for hemolysin
MRKAMDEELSDYGITFAQLEVISILYNEDGKEHRQLIEKIGTTSATLSSTLDGLVAQQLVQRQLSADDARVKCIFLTEKGRTLANKVNQVFIDFQKRVLQGFTPAETHLLHEWLTRIDGNLDHPLKKPL